MLRIFFFLAFITAFLCGCKSSDEQSGIEEWRIDPEALKYIKLSIINRCHSGCFKPHHSGEAGIKSTGFFHGGIA
jgi:hypothetical protein